MSYSVREKKVLKLLKSQDISKLSDIIIKKRNITLKKEATFALGKLAVQKNQTDTNKIKILELLYAYFNNHRENKIVTYATIKVLHDIAKYESGIPFSPYSKEIIEQFQGSFHSNDKEIKIRSLAAATSITSPSHIITVYNKQNDGSNNEERASPKSNMSVSTAKGVLITLNNDWSKINEFFKNNGYIPLTKQSSIDAAKNLTIEKYFPVQKYRKVLSSSPDGKTDYCWVELELKTRSIGKQEIDYCLKDLTKTVGASLLDPVVKWFESIKAQKTTFDFIKFRVVGCFDVFEYRKIQKENSDVNLPDVDRQLANKFCELIAEKKVYSDIYDAFSNAPGAQTSPVLNYFSKKWPLGLTGAVLRMDDKCRMGEKISVLLNIENKLKNSTLIMDRDFKLVVQSTYFNCSPPTLKGNLKHGEPYSCVVELIPKLSEMLKDDAKYLITFQLVEPINNAVLQECKLRLALSPPDLEITGTRSFLPYTGSQMSVTLNVVLRSKFDDKDSDWLPIQISCHSEPDFKSLDLATTDAKKTIHVSKEPTQITFLFQPNRAGIAAYRNRLTFNFFLGARTDSFACYALEMTVLPNLLDTAIAGGTVLVGALSQLAPAWVPPLGADLNLTTVGSSAAFIYLGFRVLTWGLNTQRTKS